MPPRQRDDRHAQLFDRAMKLRDDGQFDEAIALLEQLVNLLGSGREPVAVHSHCQMAFIRKQQGRFLDSERHYRHAVALAPAFDLASLGHFHVLLHLGRRTEALVEMVRFLSERESLGYRELLADGGFRMDVPPTDRRLAELARHLLAKHREAQRARSEPRKGDTVRVRANAPESARPGSLAVVRRQCAGEPVVAFVVEFSDGERVELPRHLLDHADI